MHASGVRSKHRTGAARMDHTDLLELGRAAFADRAWGDAYDRLADADSGSALTPDDLERLATAAYLTGHDAESTDAWTRVHRAWLAAGEQERAVRSAFWLGFGLIQRGEMAQGGGWLARAASMLEEHRLDSVQRGYLLVPQALMALDAGDTDVALARFDEVRVLGQRFGDVDLATLGTLGRGQAQLSLGQIAEGMRGFDEAMVSVTAGDTSPVIAGLVYCAVIEGCQRVSDLPRAREWTAALDRWCEAQPGLVPYRGQCLVHRAQVLHAGGAWADALTEAERARARLTDPPHPAVGMAHYELGELHRLRGDVTEAEIAYRLAHGAGRDPQPGMALLRLSQGEIEVAQTSIGSALDQASDDLTRLELLPAYVEVMLAAGRQDAAEAAADELDRLADDSAPVLRAIAARTRGAVLLAGGDPSGAVTILRDALSRWQQLDVPYEVARVRVLLAAACQQLDDHDRARLECDAAREALEELGARPALVELDRLDPGATDGVHAGPLTEREVEVLRLVADGRTNREIAEELAISEKTVERHLGNVFTKLDVSNRAAATAWAYDHHVL